MYSFLYVAERPAWKWKSSSTKRISTSRSLALNMVIVKCWTFLQVQEEKEGSKLWKVLLKFIAIHDCHLQKKRKVFLAGLFNTVVNYATTKELKEMSKGSKEIYENVVPSLDNKQDNSD